MANKENIPVKSKSNKSVALKHPALEMEKAFDHLFGNGWSWPNAFHVHGFPTADIEGSRLPKVDLIDRKNEMLVRAELPGLSKKDVEVTLDGDLLMVKGHVETEKEEEEGNYYKHEIHNASFNRSISVPKNIDGSKIKASVKDGVLEVTLPKTKETKKHTVNVQ